jgi:hypothetical protein
MKKTLIMVAILMMAFLAWGQGLETFANMPETGSSYSTGTFLGQDGSTWNYVQSRSDIDITGNAAMLGRNRSPQANIYSGTISGGIGTLSFNFMQVYSTNVNLNVLVNDIVVGNVTSSGEQSVIKSSGSITVNVSGDFVIKFINVNNSDGQVCIDDISWTSYSGGGPVPPSISNILQTPSADITFSTTVSVSADITQGDAVIDYVELWWGTSVGTYPNTINMTLDSGVTYTTDSDISAQSDGTTVYYVIYAMDVDAEDATSLEQSYTVTDPSSTTLPYAETFDADLGDCYTYSVSGATKEWIWNSSGFAYMSGYNSGDTEEDWLILPGINLDSYSDEIMTFETSYQYGTDDANNYFKLYYSTDYTGIGDPTSATWTELAYTQPASASTWTGSGDVDLSGISGTSVWLGYRYRYEVGMYRNWSLDNISIQEVSTPVITVTAPNGGESYEIGKEAAITWDYSGFAIPGNVQVDIYKSGFFAFTLNASTPNDGEGSGTIPNDPLLIADDYRVRITSIEQPTIWDESDGDFSIIDEIIVADFVIINEVDADTPGTDADEFIELYDGGVGNTALDGLVLVLFNGSGDVSYNAIDLDTYSTDANGYFVLGSASVPNVDVVIGTTNIIQNGADAVALYIGDDTDFPTNTPVTTTNLIDALVHGTNDADDAGLLVLLNADQPQVNDTDVSSMQRLANGTGGQRNTDTYQLATPTPGAENQSDYPDPAVGDLLITEVAGDNASGTKADDGFVEIWNRRDVTLNLNNVMVQYNNSSKTLVELNLTGTIEPNAYIIIAESSTFSSTYIGLTADYINSGFTFSGGAEWMEIRTPERALIDGFNLPGGSFLWSADSRYERISTGNGGNIENWAEVSGNGSPGEVNDTPLPVTLSYFAAVFQNGYSTVSWQTQSEVNNSHWNVYRSDTNNLGQAAKINPERIEGAGTTSELTEYNYADNSGFEFNHTYYYWIESVDYANTSTFHGPVSVETPEQDNPEAPEVPIVLGLHQNYPNPFNPDTNIHFAVAEDSEVELTIYNAKGQKIATVFSGNVTANTTSNPYHEATWNGKDMTGNDVASGIYMYRLETENKTYMRKMLLVK